MSELIKIDLSKLTLDQQKAVVEYISTHKSCREDMETDRHFVMPEDVRKIYKGSWNKPWTWFSWKWEINDQVVKECYK